MANRRDITDRAPDAVSAFVEEMRRAPAPADAVGRGRLIFALDATASRRPTWDQACSVQGDMFLEADRLGGLDVQLAFYRGYDECKASRWVGQAGELIKLMVRVGCRAGRTQIHRILRHAINETGKRRVHALIFIGDACEESVDTLGDLAGRLGLLGVKAFVFHEGNDRQAAYAFQEIARLTGGAACRFDASAPAELRALLRAVAAYAAGGRKALVDLSKREGGPVALLERQIR
ncbi:MAG: VWA domain-containing protein [Geminicoccaceae bacterium]